MTPILLALLIGGPPAQATQTAQSVLDAVNAKLAGAKAISFDVLQKSGGKDTHVGYRMLKGGYLRLATDRVEMIYTPSEQWMLMPELKQYRLDKSPRIPEPSLMLPGLGWDEAKDVAKASGQAAKGWLYGKAVTKVRIEQPGMKGSLVMLVDPDRSLPVGYEFNTGKETMLLEIRDFVVDPPLTPASFAWTPPADWKDMRVVQGAEPSYDATLLKVGATAPQFSAKTPKGDVTTLAAQLKGHKAVLINFWFYG